MKDVYGRELPPSLYQKNDTMRLLGEQRGSEIFWLNDEARKQVRQISEARPYSFTLADSDCMKSWIFTEWTKIQRILCCWMKRRKSVSVKIRISYTEDKELAKVIRLLLPVVKSWKLQPQKGQYKRAYIETKRLQ